MLEARGFRPALLLRIISVGDLGLNLVCDPKPGGPLSMHHFPDLWISSCLENLRALFGEFPSFVRFHTQ